MSFTYEDRVSDSPFIQSIWRTRGESQGCYLALADGSWDLLLVKQNGTTQVFIAGASTRASPVPYEAGVEYLGIRFRIGTFLSHLPSNQLADNMIQLSPATSTSFWLDDSMLPFPDYNQVEQFVKRLVRAKLLDYDPVVDAALQGDTEAISVRTLQRRFLRVAGITHSAIRQIERARTAAALLQQGTPILDAVFELGYTDQSHLTHALKRVMGQTPRQIARQSQPK